MKNDKRAFKRQNVGINERLEEERISKTIDGSLTEIKIKP